MSREIRIDLIKKVLFIRLGALGDVINTLPALSAFRDRFKDVFIGFAVDESSSDLIKNHPDVDKVFVFRKKRWVNSPFNHLDEILSYRNSIRRENFDASIDFQGNMKGSFHTISAGAKYKIGFAKGHCYEFNYLFTNIHVKPKKRHRIEKFISALEPFGIVDPQVNFKLPALNGPRFSVSYVAIHAGTSDFAPEKRWPPENFAKLARLYVEKLSTRVLLTWGLGEFKLVKLIKKLSECDNVEISPKTRGVLDLASLIKNARLFTSADTGPMHLADALGTPTVCLFGPKDPAVYGPYKCKNKVIWESSGMRNITVEQVLNEAIKLLS